MRRFYFILITCIFSLSISAQRVINPNQRKEQTVIDKVQYRVTYRTKSVQNTENKDERGGYIYSSDDMRLDIGSKLSKFYSYSKEAYEAKMLEYYQKGSFDTRPKMNGGALSWVLYRNYPTGKTLYLDAVLMDEFRVEEPMEQPDWQLVPDSVATILGYNCQMARTIYKGRMWTAWYTEDIPLDNGPWKLCGLPGLILRAYDSDQQYVFDGIGLEQLNGSADVLYIKVYDKAEQVTMSQFDDLAAKTTIYDVMRAKGYEVKVVSVGNGDGTKEDVLRSFRQRTPRNPIEWGNSTKQ